MKLNLIFLIAIIFYSCSSAKITKSFYGNTYAYKYEMVKPIADTTLQYSDDKMAFQFYFTDENLNFKVTNKSQDVYKVIWEETSLVILGQVEKIMHNGVKYIDRNGAQPPTTIPPGASLDDLVTPNSNVYFNSGDYGGWRTHPIFLKYDNKKPETAELIKRTKGQQITLYLPIRTQAGSEIGYTFIFKVRDVTCLTCDIK